MAADSAGQSLLGRTVNMTSKVAEKKVLVLDDLDIEMLANRVYETRLIRRNEPPLGHFQYGVAANITTICNIGELPTHPGKLALSARMVFELRFGVGEAPHAPDINPVAELMLSLDAAFTTKSAPVPPDTKLGPRTMNIIGRYFVPVADAHIRQLLSMAQLPFSITPDRLVELVDQAKFTDSPSASPPK